MPWYTHTHGGVSGPSEVPDTLQTVGERRGKTWQSIVFCGQIKKEDKHILEGKERGWWVQRVWFCIMKQGWDGAGTLLHTCITSHLHSSRSINLHVFFNFSSVSCPNLSWFSFLFFSFLLFFLFNVHRNYELNNNNPLLYIYLFTFITLLTLPLLVMREIISVHVGQVRRTPLIVSFWHGATAKYGQWTYTFSYHESNRPVFRLVMLVGSW